jgi:hypothetical protein
LGAGASRQTSSPTPCGPCPPNPPRTARAGAVPDPKAGSLTLRPPPTPTMHVQVCRAELSLACELNKARPAPPTPAARRARPGRGAEAGACGAPGAQVVVPVIFGEMPGMNDRPAPAVQRAGGNTWWPPRGLGAQLGARSPVNLYEASGPSPVLALLL